jgi:mRNA interferase YafQ
MRKIEQTGQYKRDLKRESKGRYRATLAVDLRPVFDALIADQPLEEKYRDHQPTGDKTDFRECHVKPDLLLMYKKQDATEAEKVEDENNKGTLYLVRLGSHSEIFR